MLIQAFAFVSLTRCSIAQDPDRETKDELTAEQVDLLRVRFELRTPMAWQGGILFPRHPPVVVDLDSGSTKPLDLRDGLILHGAVDRPEGPLVLAESPQHDLLLLVRNRDGWASCELSMSTYDPRHTSTALAADHDRIVVLVDSLLQRFEDGRWTSMQLESVARPREGIRIYQPQHALLYGRRLLLGYDDGEWGGDLVSLDIDTGVRREVEEGMLDARMETPVTGLILDHTEKLWCVCGLAHLEGLRGSLYRNDGDRWTLLSHSCNFCDDEDDPIPRGDWNLSPTSFEAAAFDEKGVLYLAVMDLGLVRREPAGGWKRITPDWSCEDYVNGLVLVGRTGWTESNDRLVGIDLDDGSTRVIPLR